MRITTNKLCFLLCHQYSGPFNSYLGSHVLRLLCVFEKETLSGCQSDENWAYAGLEFCQRDLHWSHIQLSTAHGGG